MILKKELSGARLKKSLNLIRANQRWHNKNKTGGNFGINLIADKDFYGDNFEISGYYNTAAIIVGLRFGKLWQPGVEITDILELTYDNLVERLNYWIARAKAMSAVTEHQPGQQCPTNLAIGLTLNGRFDITLEERKTLVLRYAKQARESIFGIKDVSIQFMIADTGLTNNELMEAIFSLEGEGKVLRIPGACFQLVN